MMVTALIAALMGMLTLYSGMLFTLTLNLDRRQREEMARQLSEVRSEAAQHRSETNQQHTQVMMRLDRIVDVLDGEHRVTVSRKARKQAKS